MQITIPDLETSKVLSFAKTLNEIEINKLSPDEKVVFAANMNWVRPFGMLFAICSIKQFRRKYHDLNCSMYCDQARNGVSYAAQMGFFKAISEMLPIGKEPGEATGNENYVPVTELDFAEMCKTSISNGRMIDSEDLLEEKSSELATVLSRGDKDVHDILTYLIREMLRNIDEHSGTRKCLICGQYWSDQTAEIAIIDEGQGILSSLRRNSIHRNYIETDEDALKWAIKAGISCAFKPDKSGGITPSGLWENSGFGLYMAREICRNLNGTFTIVSGNQYLSILSNGHINTGDTYIQGTAIRMNISTRNLGESKKLIREIAAQGEEQAKTIRNAFKRASVPSKGLINNY